MKYGRVEMLQDQLKWEKEKLNRLDKNTQEYLEQEKWVADMEKEIAELQIKKCARCGKEIKGYPAISRKDNKTEICSECGVEEAMEAFLTAR